MNTFHQTELTSFSSYHEDLLDLERIEENENREVLRSKLKGIAVKLSLLERYGINLFSILNSTTMNIIVDAEHERLDHWFELEIANKSIKISDLSRISLTVQIKRDDAIDQYLNLRKWIDLGLSLVIVAGHTSYLKGKATFQGNLLNRFVTFSTFEGIKYFGISATLCKKITSYGIDLSNKVLELQGYQKLRSSAVWIYYTGLNVSIEAQEYLKRRDSEIETKLICRTLSDIIEISLNHNVWIFLGTSSDNEFYDKLELIENMMK